MSVLSRHTWAQWAAALAMSASAWITVPAGSQTLPASADAVTVVVEVTLTRGSTADEALTALNDLRWMMKRQPGYLSEEFLQNLNADNAPRYAHVSRWASMAYWAALFRTPEFSQLSAHGQQHYTLSVSAFQPVK